MGFSHRNFQQALENGDPLLLRPNGPPLQRETHLQLRNSSTQDPQACNAVRYHEIGRPTLPLSLEPNISFGWPCDKYVLCYVDPKGKARCKAPEGLELIPSAEQKFSSVFRRVILGCCVGSSSTTSEAAQRVTASSSNSDDSSLVTRRSPTAHRKRRRSVLYDVSPRGRAPKARSPTIQHGRSSEDEASDDDCMPMDLDQNSKLYFRVDNATDIRKYVEETLDKFQQNNCKTIAKAWIAMLEPGKQTKFPYNAKKRAGEDDEKTKAKGTSPWWWPADVPHTEPDHLPKPKRVKLLMHIIYIVDNLKKRHDELVAMKEEAEAMSEIQSKKLQEERESLARVLSFKMKDFRQSAKFVEYKCDPPEAFICVEEILRVREYQENFESGSIDGTSRFPAKSPTAMNDLIKEAKRKAKESSLVASTGLTAVIAPPREVCSSSPSPALHDKHDIRQTSEDYQSPSKKIRSHVIDNAAPQESSLRRSTPMKRVSSDRHMRSVANPSVPWREPNQTFRHEYPHYYDTISPTEPTTSSYRRDIATSESGLLPYSPNELNDFYPRYEYAIPQSQEPSMIPASHPRSPPPPLKWSPMQQNHYISPNAMQMTTTRSVNTQMPPPSPCLGVTQLFLHPQMSDVNGSAASSFTSDCDSQPLFRTGSISHPNPRTGSPTDFMM